MGPLRRGPLAPPLDDDARTELVLETASAVLDLPELGEPMQARFLTLTSSAETGGDPIAWRLEGSDDGQSWEVLDARSARASSGDARPAPSRSPPRGRACITAWW
ncbi:hypothetical protein [Brachybacterium sp. GPGPB12]|uniref:hypothetical protein n=1 Tax=Brachybacterium sp. GPGPB12 TaxID=3023517 RepID=UPI0031344DB4